MTLPLNRDMLAACYDFLASTPPFSTKWPVPHSEEVKFRVVKSRDVRGWYMQDRDGKHILAISSGCCADSTVTLLLTMAHEMAHLAIGEHNIDSGKAEHSRAFWKIAKEICDHHGFAYGVF